MSGRFYAQFGLYAVRRVHERGGTQALARHLQLSCLLDHLQVGRVPMSTASRVRHGQWHMRGLRRRGRQCVHQIHRRRRIRLYGVRGQLDESKTGWYVHIRQTVGARGDVHARRKTMSSASETRRIARKLHVVRIRKVHLLRGHHVSGSPRRVFTKHGRHEPRVRLDGRSGANLQTRCEQRPREMPRPSDTRNEQLLRVWWAMSRRYVQFAISRFVPSLGSQPNSPSERLRIRATPERYDVSGRVGGRVDHICGLSPS